MFRGRWNWLILAFLTPLAYILLHQVFATAWSNKCDPGNQQFYLMKNDRVTTFQAPGQLFTWEYDSPDNSWMCSDASLYINHVGPDVNAMFDATKSDMQSNGWSELAPSPDSDFAVLEKVSAGVTMNAVMHKELLRVVVHINVPGLHPGEFGFSSS